MYNIQKGRVNLYVMNMVVFVREIYFSKAHRLIFTNVRFLDHYSFTLPLRWAIRNINDIKRQT